MAGCLPMSGDRDENNVTNVLLTTVSGLDLPPTICLTVPADVALSELLSQIEALLPCRSLPDVYLSTHDGLHVRPSDASLRTLSTASLHRNVALSFLPLRLNVRLRGGKGGFGSQLRAAGGRMSSRKKKQNAELATSSARNLDGRRLRTITEAKNLATYLATRPDMDRKEKEERRKRWETVVELAEQREADMRAGKTIDGRRKGLSTEWMEEKEEVGENIKNAVKMAMVSNEHEPDRSQMSAKQALATDSTDEDSDADEAMELDESEMTRLQIEAEAGDADALWVLQNQLKIPKDLLPKPISRTTRFDGFDDDLSDTESESGTASETDNGPPALAKTTTSIK